MSDVLNKMKSRRSIRKFKPDMVPQEILDQIIEAGLYAASGMGRGNVQLMYTMEALLWVTSCLPHMNLASEAAGFIVQKKSLNLTGAEIS